jgi:HEAT repeat protein
MSSLIIDKLQQYLDHKLSLNTDEMSFAIYLLGESRNLAGKDVLLRLTYDERTRIRSAAVNALGKFNLNESDPDFAEKVSDRLIELASENNPKKTYNKDIAFAFRNFKSEKDIPVLINMMSNNYYGVRFVASDDLAQYGDMYYDRLTGDVLSSVSSDRIRFIAFLNSLRSLSANKFEEIMNRILKLDISRDEAVNYNLISLLRAKRESTNDSSFLSWLNGVIAQLESRAEQKVR